MRQACEGASVEAVRMVGGSLETQVRDHDGLDQHRVTEVELGQSNWTESILVRSTAEATHVVSTLIPDHSDQGLSLESPTITANWGMY